MHRLNTSLRECTTKFTLEHAKHYIEKLGISRVTDTTRLDRIGVPVYSSIRPAAAEGSICVHAGKGLEKAEAMTGAIMEAIEFGFAEFKHSNLEIHEVLPAHILGRDNGSEAILDLCPKMNAEIKMNKSIHAVRVLELNSNFELDVPAELVFTPFLHDGPIYFGSHSNGLSSGNTVTEASIHGILEVIERDVVTFNNFEDSGTLINIDTLPKSFEPIVANIRGADLELTVKYIENPLELPVFICWLIEPHLEIPSYINVGFGCHIHKSIALMRAVTEAIQSRMSFIHGGRDDLIHDYELYDSMGKSERSKHFQESVHKIRTTMGAIDYEKVPEVDWKYNNLNELLSALLQHLQKHCFNQVVQAIHTRKEDTLQVVKIIIPRMEFFTTENKRVGPRLKKRIDEITDDHLRGA
ncbi:MAG: YcaO-like family protein [Aurantibacter sp.]